MPNTLIQKLYGGNVEIVFYPDSHRYRLSGEKSYLISVTAATGMIDKSRVLMQWAIGLAGGHLKQYLENSPVNKYSAEELLPVIEEACKLYEVKRDEAASIGSQVHDWAEKFAQAKISKTELPEIPETDDERIINGIHGFLDWHEKNDVEFIACENIVFSKEHKFVGKFDVVAKVNGRKVIIDYKTAKGVYSDMHYQVAAYRLAYEEEHGKIDGATILHFNKETGDFNVYEFTDEDHEKNYPVFLACLKIKEREKELSKY